MFGLPKYFATVRCKYKRLTGGVFVLKSLFNLSVNPCNNVFPPATITLLYKL